MQPPATAAGLPASAAATLASFAPASVIVATPACVAAGGAAGAGVAGAGSAVGAGAVAAGVGGAAVSRRGRRGLFFFARGERDTEGDANESAHGERADVELFHGRSIARSRIDVQARKSGPSTSTQGNRPVRRSSQGGEEAGRAEGKLNEAVPIRRLSYFSPPRLPASL